jgi:FkbM family methyltransferase
LATSRWTFASIPLRTLADVLERGVAAPPDRDDRTMRPLDRHSVLNYVRERAMSRVWTGLGHVTAELTIRTRQGRYRVLTRDQAIGRHLFATGEYEFDLTRAVVDLLESLGIPVRGGTLLDVGGNIGITTVSMLVAGQVSRAIAVEPDPTNFRLLEHNVRLNGLEDRARCIRMAASDTRGELELELCDYNPGDNRIRIADPGATPSSHMVRVAAAPLDECITDPIDLLWIDTQGHEAHVLRGAQRLISSGVPTVLELWPHGLAAAGTTRDEFCSLARRYWSQYWLPRDRGMVRYPMAALESVWDEWPSYDAFSSGVFLP